MLPHDILENRIKRLSNTDVLKEKLESTRNFIDKNLGNIFVACCDEQVVGIVEVGGGKDKYKDYGHLGAIYLLKEYHGNHIGKELFKIGIKRLIDIGYDKMQLECMKNNPTLGFYEKYGGYVDETIDDAIYGVEVKVDIVLFDNIKEIYNKLVG